MVFAVFRASVRRCARVFGRVFSGSTLCLTGAIACSRETTMKKETRATFNTTITMPLAVQMELDAVRSHRAAELGRRVPTRALILEALELFLAAQARAGVRGVRARPTSRPRA